MDLEQLLEDLPSPYMTMEAALSFEPLQEGKPRRFKMVAYDGGKLRLHNFKLPVVVDLDGVKRTKSLQALRDHDFRKPVGPMTEFEIKNNQILTAGHFAFADQQREIETAQDLGFSWQASIGGYHNLKKMELLAAGQTAQVNGRSFTGPLLISREATIREVSFVSYGAGENTAAFAAAAELWEETTPTETPPPRNRKEQTTDHANPPRDASVGKTNTSRIPLKAANMDFEAYCTSIGVEATDENRQVLEAAWRASEKEDDSQENAILKELADLKASMQSFQNRSAVDEVNRIAEQYGVTNADLLKELRAAAGDGEIAPSDAELRILQAAYQTGTEGFQPVGRTRQAPASQHVYEAALLASMGWSEEQLGQHYSEEVLNASADSRWEGFGIRGLMHEYLTAHGQHITGGRLQPDDVQRGLEIDWQSRLQAAGGASSFSLSGVTDNVATKLVLQPYNEAPKAILEICKIVSSTDYKPVNLYRLNGAGKLEPVGNDGELASTEFSNDKYTVQAEQYGRKLCITEKMWTDDDLNMLSDAGAQLSMLAIRSLEEMGFAEYLDGVGSTWVADSNLVEVDVALGIDGLSEAYELFLSQTDAEDNPINLEPSILLVGSPNATLARQLNNDTNIVVAGSTDVKTTNSNPWKSMFKPVHTPYLNTGRVTNANGTNWFLIHKSGITAPMAAVFLNGRRSPRIRRHTNIPGKLVMQWDMDFSFGFAKHDAKASVYSPGQ